MAKKTSKKRGVKAIEPTFKPEGPVHKQSKRKGHGSKKMTAKKCM